MNMEKHRCSVKTIDMERTYVHVYYITFLSPAVFFKISFFEKFFHEKIRVSNSLAERLA